MDMKIKIIIVIFVAIAFLYVGHFIINYMAKTTKQEGFMERFNDIEDVEHYEEPQELPKKATGKTQGSSKYDQRILVLDDIEKIKITDKDLKGKLMEILFDDEMLKQISDMSASERLTYIKKKYESMVKSATSDVKEDEAELPKETAQEATKSGFEPTTPTETPSATPEVDTSGLLNKTQETISALKSVQLGLSEIHKIAETFKSHVQKTHHTDKSSFKEPYIPPTTLIEGFENARSYAPLL